MSVIALAVMALLIGGVVIGLLSVFSPPSQCEEIYNEPACGYNVCILLKSHEELHMTADGRRF